MAKKCTKLRHPTPESAGLHIRMLIEKGDRRAHRLNIYRCWRCNWTWHVGHRRKKAIPGYSRK